LLIPSKINKYIMSKVEEKVHYYHSKIKDWPLDERPREKLLKFGAGALSDSELLAIIISSGTKKITAVDVAKTVLKEFGSLGEISSKSVLEIKNRIKKGGGLGQAKIIKLVASFEIGRRASAQSVGPQITVRNPQDIANYYIPQLKDLKQEIFRIALLDSANHFMKDVIITQGILNTSLVHPREVFKPAILEPSANIILIHNHPSGEYRPSEEDIEITKQLVEAGKILGISVFDHIIIAKDKFFSFATENLL
jgi:DNA repair protein RadC